MRLLAESTAIEPATSVTGRRPNRRNYKPVFLDHWPCRSKMPLPPPAVTRARTCAVRGWCMGILRILVEVDLIVCEGASRYSAAPPHDYYDLPLTQEAADFAIPFFAEASVLFSPKKSTDRYCRYR